MLRDIIFERLTVSSLDRIVKYLDWNPSVSDSSTTRLSDLSDEERFAWLDRNRTKIEDKISQVGSPFLSDVFGTRKSYHQIVRDLGGQLGVEGAYTKGIEQLEKETVNKVLNDTLVRLKPEEKQEFVSKIKELECRQAPSINDKRFAAFADLSAEHLFGLGGSTDLAKLFALAAGPILGPLILAVPRRDSPNYEKLLPVVVRIAAERALEEPPQGTVSQDDVNREVEKWPPFAGLCPSSKDAFETAVQHHLSAAANQSRRDSDLRTAAFYFSKAVECELREKVFEPFRVHILNSRPRDPLINKCGDPDKYLNSYVDGDERITFGQMRISMIYVNTLNIYIQNHFQQLRSPAILGKLNKLVPLCNAEKHDRLDPQLAAQARELAKSVIEAMN
jgi:uncharacterized protein YaaW (UPF0174 family)